MENENSVKNVLMPVVGRIIKAGAVLSLLGWLITLFTGSALKAALGFAVGYGFMCFSMLWLAGTCEKAVTLPADKAKRLMKQCYILRCCLLFALCAAAMLTKAVNVVGVLVPQFFPKIILTFDKIVSRKGGSHE